MSTETAVVVKETALRTLLVLCGFKGADDPKKWPMKRLQVSAAKINDMCDDDTNIKDPELAEKLKEILAAIEAGGTITVEADYEGSAGEEMVEATPPKPAVKPKGGKQKPPAAPPAEEATGEAEAEGNSEAAEEMAETTEVKSKRTRTKKAEKTGPSHVRQAKDSATYVAGKIIAKHGLEVGVTDAMVAEVGNELGRENPHQDWFNLRNAHHSIRGYLDTVATAAAE